MGKLELVQGSLGLRRGWGHGVLRLLDIQALVKVSEEQRTAGDGEVLGVASQGAGARRLGSSCGWKHREAFYGRLGNDSIGRPSHGFPQRI